MARTKRTKVWELKFTFPGLFMGGTFAILALTPSLLPRGWFFIGVLLAITFATGYGVGNAIGAFYRYFDLREPSPKLKHNIKRTCFVLGAVLFISMMVMSNVWNNNLLELTNQEPNSQMHLIRVLLVAGGLTYLIIAISRWIRNGVRLAKRWTLKVMPKKIALFVGSILGLLFVYLLFSGIFMRGVMTAVNYGFSHRDASTDEGIVQPTSPLRSGSEESLVAWDELGRQGRKFTGGGPTQQDISGFMGTEADQPIRVYVGLKSAETIDARVDLAMQELIRTGAFEREVLLVTTTTGTGWLDPGAMDTIEYVHGGDTAIVGLQYSYLPSWISLFVDQQITLDTSVATLLAVHDYWTQLDENTRPELYLFGLSLGSFGSVNSSQNLRLINDPVDGSLWAGTPFMTEPWEVLTANRDAGSPVWQPIVDDGRVARFSDDGEDYDDFEQPWEGVRYGFLQHSDDPIVWFSPSLVFNQPEWLEVGQRGPSISSDMVWFPFVTFWQVAADMPAATAVPGGYGHAYSPASYIDSWVEITTPENWTETQSEALKQHFNR